MNNAKNTEFDPDKAPEVAEMRRDFERLQKAHDKAERQRAELKRRAEEAREEAEAREEKAEELEREIRAAFINGNDEKATKLQGNKEGEQTRAAMNRRKAETLEQKASEVEVEDLNPAPHPEAARLYWIRVYEAVEREFRRRAAKLAGLGAFAFGQGHSTGISPSDFAERALRKEFPIIGRYGIGLDDEDLPIPRPGVLASMLEPEADEEKVA